MYVYNTINIPDRKPTRERVSDLLMFSGNNLIPPYYLKNLRRLDLSHTHLQGACLGRAILEGAINLPISLDEAKARGAST